MGTLSDELRNELSQHGWTTGTLAFFRSLSALCILTDALARAYDLFHALPIGQLANVLSVVACPFCGAIPKRSSDVTGRCHSCEATYSVRSYGIAWHPLNGPECPSCGVRMRRFGIAASCEDCGAGAYLVPPKKDEEPGAERSEKWNLLKAGARGRVDESHLLDRILMKRAVEDERRRLDPDDLRGKIGRILALSSDAARLNTDPALRAGLELVAQVATHLRLLAEDPVIPDVIGMALSARPANEAKIAAASERRKKLSRRHAGALDVVRWIRGDADRAVLIDEILRETTYDRESPCSDEVRDYAHRHIEAVLGARIPPESVVRAMATYSRRRRGRSRKGVKRAFAADCLEAVNALLADAHTCPISPDTLEKYRRARDEAVRRLTGGTWRGPKIP